LTGYFNTGLELNTLVKDTDAFKQIVNRKLGLFGESWKSMNALAASFGSDIEY
jgi:ABC-type transporter Mla subunit MlaD